MSMLKAARLRPGARVALVSPAGPSTPERVRAAIERCHSFDLEPVLGASASDRTGYLAGPDSARLADLQNAFDDASIDSIWAIRGGYGAMRILPHLDLTAMRRRPKPFVGFSDNTALHLALSRAGIVSFHGPHAGAELPPLAEKCLRSALFDESAAGVLPLAADDPPPATFHGGVAEGELIGGNLALVAALCGTPWALQARGRIVVLEDVGEAVYRVDRMLAQLALAGTMEGVAGIAFGRFTELPEEEDAAALDELLRDWSRSYGVPVVYGLPIGHVDENWTLPFGVRARLDADAGTLAILEPAVEP